MDDDKANESSIGTQPMEKENQPLQSVPPQQDACPVDESDVSSDDDEILVDPLTLRQRRARNIQRNQAYLLELGLAQQAPNKRAVAATRSEKAQKENTPRRGGGMLRQWNTTTTATTTTFSDLMRDYPGRKSVIRALWGWLHRGSPLDGSLLPLHAAMAPILVTGPAGTGKTALVRAIVATAASRSVAYVSCAAVTAGGGGGGGALVQQVLQSAYQQLAQQANQQLQDDVRSNNNSKKRRRHVERPLTLETTMTKGDEDDEEVDLEDRLEAKRRRRGRKKKPVTATASSSSSSTTAKASSVHTAVWAFGRALLALQTQGQMILVLDEAERLVTEHDVNVLAQLYLLPQALQIPLQIVLVTRSVLLCESRLNASLGTLSTCIQPIRIHFAAYRGQEQLKAILSTLHMRRKIVGMDDDHDNNDNEKWQEAVYQSFLHTLIQSLQDVSNSLHDYLHWGRALWPHYVQPLEPNVLEETVASLAASRRDDESMEQAVLGLLNRRLYPLVRAGLEHGLWQSQLQSATNQHSPVLVRYMLLAAFLCQANRPDKDRHLYTNASNRRRNNHATADDNQQADLDRTVRPRAFGLERLLSVYASLVQLHHSCDDAAPADDGLVVLLEAQALGWLQQQSPGRYATTLLPNQARAMARSLDFALDRYLTS